MVNDFFFDLKKKMFTMNIIIIEAFIYPHDVIKDLAICGVWLKSLTRFMIMFNTSVFQCHLSLCPCLCLSLSLQDIRSRFYIFLPFYSPYLFSCPFAVAFLHVLHIVFYTENFQHIGLSLSSELT